MLFKTEYNQNAKKTSIPKMLEGKRVLQLQFLYILTRGEACGNIKRTIWIRKNSPDKKIPAAYLLRFFWRLCSMSRTSRRLARLCNGVIEFDRNLLFSDEKVQ